MCKLFLNYGDVNNIIRGPEASCSSSQLLNLFMVMSLIHLVSKSYHVFTIQLKKR